MMAIIPIISIISNPFNSPKIDTYFLYKIGLMNAPRLKQLVAIDNWYTSYYLVKSFLRRNS